MNHKLKLLLFLTLTVAQTQAASVRQVDDSYTPTERFERYVKKDASLKRAVLSMSAGQQLEFDLRYKKVGKRELHLDLFQPVPQFRNGQSLLLVHGGAWRTGHRSHLYPLANLLAQKGYTVFVPEYRLAVEATYPAGMEDLYDAMAWIQENAQQFQIDPKQVSVLGGSSGGHMAALLGLSASHGIYRTEGAPAIQVKAVIDLDGVLDLSLAEVHKSERATDPKSPLSFWLGATVDAKPELWQQASPLSYLSDKMPDVLVISSGQPRFTQGKSRLEQHLAKLDSRFDYYEFDKVIHTFWLFEPYLSVVSAQVDQFLTPPKKN